MFYSPDKPPSERWPTDGFAFAETEAAKRITAVIDLARSEGQIVTITGNPGLGKTRALRHYVENYPATVLATMSPDTSKPKACVQEILISMNREITQKSDANMRREIAWNLRDFNKTLIVDECQDLSGAALEVLRRIHDDSGRGLVLAGQPTLSDQIKPFAQLTSRIGLNYRMGPPSRSDVALIVSDFGIVDDDSIDLLHGVAQLPGAHREINRVLKIAVLLCEAEGVDQIEFRHVEAAHRQRQQQMGS